MSTHNICFCGEIRKILAFQLEKRSLIWSYECAMSITEYICAVLRLASYKVLFYQSKSTPQPLYNTIVGVQSINSVSSTTMLYSNKNV